MRFDFADLGFTISHHVSGLSGIQSLFPENCRCGIYILHFSNQQYYVGLSVNVVARFNQHLENHTDIEYISFKPTPGSRLKEEEKKTIYALEQLNLSLRNISLVSIINSKSDFDSLVTPEDQQKWLNYELPFETLLTDRFEYPELRAKYTKKFETFRQYPFFDLCCAMLQEYVNYTIPFPRKTEYAFWSCSCLPDSATLLRVNIYWQETLIMMEDEFTGEINGQQQTLKDITICIWLAKSRLFEHYTEQTLLQKYSTLELGTTIHETGGQDQQQIIISATEFFDFLYDPPVSDAIKLFNLRLMRKGSCINNRYHCFDLADYAVRTDNLNWQ